jgi:RecA/RadA recombinase
MSNELKNTIKKKLSSKETKPKTEYLSTGCTLLDLVVGGGLGMGFPVGKIINFIGDKSAGKTFLSMEMIAANKYKYGKRFKWNFDDGESGNTFDTQALYGFDVVRKEEDYNSSKIEDLDVNVLQFLRKKMKKEDELGLYVIDSLDGLGDSEKEERSEERYKQATAGKKIKESGTFGTATPKFLSQEFFKTKTEQFQSKNAVLVIVSQVRENMNAGLFGKKLKRNGGKAMDFYAHTCLWLSTWIKIKRKDMNKEDRQVGVIVEAYTDKSKTPRPYRKCRFIVYFDYGIDDIGSNLDYIYNCWGEDGKLKKSSENIPWGGDKKLNLSNFKELLEENSALDLAREDSAICTGKRTLKLDWLQTWIKDQEDLFVKYKKTFGEPVAYEELITKISEDPKMEKQLKKMVVEKWEAAEASIQTNRKRKYS